jgi:ribonuclease HII
MAVTAPQLRGSIKGKAPGTRYESDLWRTGSGVVAGIDEVGRGSWAGPLTLAAVVVPRDKRLYKVRDSKMLTAAEREIMHDRIIDWADRVAVAHATHEECDALGMSAAQKLAAQRVLSALGVAVDHVLVDGNWDFVESHPTTLIVKGDAVSLSIAAASIVAKVTRDRLMREWDADHPAYGFAGNKGYPCPRHKAALAAYGPSTLHRRRWAFMDDLRWTAIPRVGPGSGVGEEDDGAQLGLF